MGGHSHLTRPYKANFSRGVGDVRQGVKDESKRLGMEVYSQYPTLATLYPLPSQLIPGDGFSAVTGAVHHDASCDACQMPVRKYYPRLIMVQGEGSKKNASHTHINCVSSKKLDLLKSHYNVDTVFSIPSIAANPSINHCIEMWEPSVEHRRIGIGARPSQKRGARIDVHKAVDAGRRKAAEQMRGGRGRAAAAKQPMQQRQQMGQKKMEQRQQQPSTMPLGARKERDERKVSGGRAERKMQEA